MEQANRAVTKSFTIANKHGMNTRACAKFVEIAQASISNVRVKKAGGKKDLDGKSILDLLMMTCPLGKVIEITIDGEDADVLFEKFGELIKNKFGFEE